MRRVNEYVSGADMLSPCLAVQLINNNNIIYIGIIWWFGMIIAN